MKPINKALIMVIPFIDIEINKINIVLSQIGSKGAIMFKSYEQFVKAKFIEYPFAGKYHTNEQEFFIAYSKLYGIGDWLATLRNCKLDLKQTHSLVSTYINNFDSKLTDLPSIFSFLQCLFKVEFPLIEGIFTAEFWDAECGK